MFACNQFSKNSAIEVFSIGLNNAGINRKFTLLLYGLCLIYSPYSVQDNSLALCSGLVLNRAYSYSVN